LGFAYGMAGRVEDARRLLERMQEAPGYVSPLELAQVHAGLGDTSAVFRLLGQAVEHRSSDLVRLRINPWPAAVRQDSRFDGIAQRIGLPPS
jgi:pentatricopeptide repeat protein